MAHQNIDARRDAVAITIARGLTISGCDTALLALRFGCSASAIVADVRFFSGTPSKKRMFSLKRFKVSIYERDGFRCQYCWSDKVNRPIAEHVIPAYHGGPLEPFNLVTACPECNTNKRRSVWIPKNMAVLETLNPDWAQRILTNATKDFRTEPRRSRFARLP
jgi:5-methylcytosine-specific restriction endonuclease McrA